MIHGMRGLRNVVALLFVTTFVHAFGDEVHQRAAGPDVRVLIPRDGLRVGATRPACIAVVASPGSSRSPIARVEIRYEAPEGFDSGYIRARHREGLWSADVGPVPRGRGRLTARVTSQAGEVATRSLVMEGVANTSMLFGVSGEFWNGPARERLPDFSHAGYHAGESLPTRPRSIDVTAAPFLARPDDPSAAAANTTAFNRAIAAASVDGAVHVPPGEYFVDGPIEIRRGHVVLRGELDPSRGLLSTIHFTRHLSDIAGAFEPKFSFEGGLIRVAPRDGATWKGSRKVVGRRTRGEKTLELNDTRGLARGMLALLRLKDEPTPSATTDPFPPAGSLLRHVHNEITFPRPPCDKMSRTLDWPFEIAGVEGNVLTLTQPLRTDVRPDDWDECKVFPSAADELPTIREIGIERLRLRFDPQPYDGHHKELGRNAIYFERDVAQSWVSDVTFDNVDSGIIVATRCKWLTLERIHFTSTRARRVRLPSDDNGDDEAVGHHAILLSRAADVLVQDVDFGSVNFNHEFSVSHQANGNVFRRARRGDGGRVDLDHHRDWPFENLFTDFAEGFTSSFDTGGSASEVGPNSAARGTFWGIGPTRVFDAAHSHSGFAFPPDRPGTSTANPIDWGKMQTNFVDHFVDSARVPVTTDIASPGRFFEEVKTLTPRDLYQAQRVLRLHLAPTPVP